MSITLRTPTVWDARIYDKLYRSNPDIQFYVSDMGRENLTQVALLMDSYARFDFINHYAYIIEDTIFGPVGALQALANKEYKSLDMQFFIGNAYRNNGYMQEAIKLFASVLKSTSYYSLLFDISTKNISATNLVVKLGAEAIDGIEQVQYELVI